MFGLEEDNLKEMSGSIIIKNKEAENNLAHNGFTVVPLITETDINELFALYKNYFSEVSLNSSYADSNANSPAEVKRKISEGILKILKPRINNLFENHEFLVSIFMTKKPTTDSSSQISMHQDPTLLIDESENQHIKIWCPLMDVDETNGALQMIRGSHLFLPPVHAVTVPNPYTNIYDTLYEMKECIRMKAGEALLFDNRTLHCSMPNSSGKIRITAIASIVAPNKQFISLYKNPKQKNAPIEVYFQDNNWFTNPLWSNTTERPLIGVKAGTLDYEPFFLNREEFISLVKNPRPYKTYKYNIIPVRKSSVFSKILSAVGA